MQSRVEDKVESTSISWQFGLLLTLMVGVSAEEVSVLHHGPDTPGPGVREDGGESRRRASGGGSGCYVTLTA